MVSVTEQYAPCVTCGSQPTGWFDFADETVLYCGMRPDEGPDYHLYEGDWYAPMCWSPASDEPDRDEMIRQLLRALGEHDGAYAESPKAVWERALDAVRLLVTWRIDA